MTIQAFDFSKLPKLTRKEILVKDSLESLFPRHRWAREIREAIVGTIQRQLSLDISLRLESFQNVSIAETLQRLNPQGVYLVFGFPPHEGKAMLEIDPFLAHMAIDKLLGGSGGAPTAIRPLTEIEDAVLSFLFLKIFHTLFEQAGQEKRFHLRMERFYSAPDQIQDQFQKLVTKDSPRNLQGWMANFQIVFGGRVGYTRLLIPQSIIEQVFLPVVRGIREGEPSRERLQSIHKFSTSLWMELGRTNVSVREINQLEPGDVVVLETSEARIDNGMLVGSLPIRVGRGEQGAIRGEIIPDRKKLKVRIEGIQRERRL